MSEEGRDYVVYGMRARCSEGTMDNYISTDTGHGVVYQGCPLLNANDHTVQVNLTHFGDCNSKKIYEDAKKQVDEKYASEAGEGFFTKAAKWAVRTVMKVNISVKEHFFFHKCELDTPLPWIFVNEEHMIDGAPALTIDSRCACRFGGIITIVPPEPETEEVEVTTGEGTMEPAMAENVQEAEIVLLSEEAEVSGEQKGKSGRNVALEKHSKLYSKLKRRRASLPNMRGGIDAFLWGDEESRQEQLEQYREMLKQNGIEIPEEPVIPEQPVVYAVVGTSKNPLPDEQQEANAEYIYNYLINEGWSESAIFGLLGNIEQESHFNPGTWRKLDNPNAAYGLAQWCDADGLYTKILEFAGEDFSAYVNKKDEMCAIVDRMAEECPLELINIQLEYLIETSRKGAEEKRWLPKSDDNCPYSMTFEDYITNPENYSVEDMALVFHGSYERSDDIPGLEKRKTYAREWHDHYHPEQAEEE